jgi:RNAse (barnase) inhibitor barstar
MMKTAMRTIMIDGSTWTKITDFYDSILAAVGAPEWHGRSIDALIDSMIWGGINELEPPYTIRIAGTNALPKDIRDHLVLARDALTESRAEFRVRKGRDVEVGLEMGE